MMLKSMREASLGSGLGDSQETQTYQDMYDQQLALQMAHGKGRRAGRDADAAADTRQCRARPGRHARHPGIGHAGSGYAGQQGAAGADKISSAQRANFVRALEPLAQSAGNSLGVAPDTLMAQAALETGWGRNIPPDSNGQQQLQPVRGQGRGFLARRGHAGEHH